jgi:regulatory protein
MKPPRRQRPSSPLDEGKLNELALRYVSRFATTRAKLRSYLARKLRERGWEGAREPDPERIAERFAEQGYVDDSSYAMAKSRSLTERGYGRRRVLDALRAAGVQEEESNEARDYADAEAVSAALRFAKRRRIGPFAVVEPVDHKHRDKALAAMIRAGHSFEIAKAVVALPRCEDLNMDQLLKMI